MIQLNYTVRFSIMSSWLWPLWELGKALVPCCWYMQFIGSPNPWSWVRLCSITAVNVVDESKRWLDDSSQSTWKGDSLQLVRNVRILLLVLLLFSSSKIFFSPQLSQQLNLARIEEETKHKTRTRRDGPHNQVVLGLCKVCFWHFFPSSRGCEGLGIAVFTYQ